MTGRLRVVIADDERLARARLRRLLRSDETAEITGEAADGDTALRLIAEHRPDVVLLDVRMPGLDGFDVLAALDPARRPAVIFTTAYDRYAVRAFEVHAVDYLLKPIEEDRLQAALGRARALRAATPASLPARLQRFLEAWEAGSRRLERLIVRSPGRVVFLRVAEISWIESADNYVQLHVGKESHLLRQTMNALEARLDPEQFLRIRRSALVNVDHIGELRPESRGEYSVVLRDGSVLESSRGYAARLRAFLDRGR